MWNWDWCSLPGTLSGSPRWLELTAVNGVDHLADPQSENRVDPAPLSSASPWSMVSRADRVSSRRPEEIG